MPDEIPHRLREVEQTLVRLATTLEKDADQRKDSIHEQREFNKSISTLVTKHDKHITILDESDKSRKKWSMIFSIPIVGLLIEKLYHLVTHT